MRSSMDAQLHEVEMSRKRHRSRAKILKTQIVLQNLYSQII